MINIKQHQLGLAAQPFIIAELSGNHNQSLERAMTIVEASARAGAHAVKLQTYTADTLTLPFKEGEFVISDANSLWKGKSLHDLFQDAHTPWDWHAPLFQRCKEVGVLCFSTPFDETAVDFLETLDSPAYKIGSFECTHLPLLERVAATGKPVILSTGMATIAEIDEAVTTLRTAGCKELVLLKCTSSYPALPDDLNLRSLPHLRQMFDCEVGVSDHTQGIGAAVAAVALGASVIEKHVTLCRADGGVDAAFSIEPNELALLVRESDRAWRSLGQVWYGPTTGEQTAVTRRRSLYVSREMQAGDILTPENLRIVRPGHGLAPRFYEVVLSRPVLKPIRAGTPLTWDLLMGSA